MWLDIQIFGFRALWSPYFFLFILCIALAYHLVTGRYRHKFGGDDKPAVKQQLAFYTALLLIYLVKGAPVDLLSHIMLTAHMTQMAVYVLVVPILLIRGIPVWIWKKVFYAPVLKGILKVFTHPLIAILLFNLIFSIYHMPSIFDFSKSSQIAHTSIAMILLFLALCMWWPIATPIKELDRMSPLLKIGYMFANGGLITPACALIIFASDPLFAAYSSEGAWIQAMSLCVPASVLEGISSTLSGAEMFSPMSTVEDQQLGGIIMQTVIQIVYVWVIGKVFFSWFKDKSESVDPLPVTTNK